MRRYWQALAENIEEGDPWSISSVIEPKDSKITSPWAVKALRYYHRRLGYPQKIKWRFRGDLAHILDHSWADMLPFVPRAAAKVVTVHDLIPLRYPGELKPAQLRRFRNWTSHVGDADAVIADSICTKEEVVTLLGIDPGRIHVVPCGVTLPVHQITTKGWIQERMATLDPEGTAFKIGSIGSTIERKNLKIFPAALSALTRGTDRKIIFVRVGEKLPPPLAEKIRKALGGGVLIELGSLKDAELMEFYRSLDAVVIPSLYEGFGLPVLEGMAARVPVVSSNATSLPEVGGDEALYFDPQSPEELAARLADLALHSFPEDSLDRAYQRAARYSWRESLRQIYNVYKIALQRRDERLAQLSR